MAAPRRVLLALLCTTLALAAALGSGAAPPEAPLRPPPPLAAAGEVPLGVPDGEPPAAAASDGRIVVPATEGVLLNAFQAVAQGAASGRVTGVSVLNDAGTLVYDGEAVGSAAYVHVLWLDFDLVLVQGLSVEAGDLHVFWLYCRAGQLLGVYDESAQGDALRWQPGAGACAASAAASATPVSFPALDMPYPPLVQGYSVQGSHVWYDGSGPGAIVLQGRTQVLLPFEAVDCSQVCGGQGWWELHSLLHDPASRQVTFAILYLAEGKPTTVSLQYGLRLPDLQRASATYAATWTTP